MDVTKKELKQMYYDMVAVRYAYSTLYWMFAKDAV
jgi:hypothetical protein